MYCNVPSNYILYDNILEMIKIKSVFTRAGGEGGKVIEWQEKEFLW